MSVGVRFKYNGEIRSTGRNAYAELSYVATGTTGDTADEAEAAVLAEAPATYAGLALEGIGLLEPVHDDDDDPRPTWQATVRYVSEELAPREPGSNRVSFRTTGGTAHITHSKKTRARYTKSGTNPIDFKQAIGVGANGDVAGTDVVVPVLEWQESHTYADSDITPEFLTTLYLMTGTTNEVTWRIFQPEDCLFMGVDGQQLENTNWELNFYFAAQPTEEIESIGEITGSGGGPIIKRGWQHLWIYFRELEGTREGESTATVLQVVPEQVNIEQIYYVDSFVSLGLGV